MQVVPGGTLPFVSPALSYVAPGTDLRYDATRFCRSHLTCASTRNAGRLCTRTDGIHQPARRLRAARLCLAQSQQSTLPSLCVGPA
eukprot:281011-Rhodomonas_salina.1